MTLFNSYYGDKGVHTFPKGINTKANVIARLVFELTCYDLVVEHFSYDATATRHYY